MTFRLIRPNRGVLRMILSLVYKIYIKRNNMELISKYQELKHKRIIDFPINKNKFLTK